MDEQQTMLSLTIVPCGGTGLPAFRRGECNISKIVKRNIKKESWPDPRNYASWKEPVRRSHP